MVGLKSYLPVLAGYLDLSPDALYERQRKLSKADLLVGATGKGPGSGVRVTPPVISLMVIAAMSSDSLAEIEVAVRTLHEQASDSGRCPLTGASNFGDALSLILASEGIASSVNGIRVLRSAAFADISYKQRGNYESSYFGRPREKYREPKRHKLERETYLPSEIVKAIASDLSSIASRGRLPLRQPPETENSSLKSERSDKE